MAVKIRLTRRGRKKKAMYDIVVADARAPRDGRFIEKLGTYNPGTDPASIVLDNDKAFDWVMKGAQPTDTARAILSYRGVMLKKHLQIGVNKGAITQEQADKKLETWLKDKDAQIQNKVDRLAKAKVADEKARLDAETKVNQARVDKLLARKQEAEAALAADVAEANADEAEAALAEEGEEAVAEAEAQATETTAEEAPAAEAEAVETEEAPTETPAEEAPEAKAEEAPAEEEKKEGE